MKLSTFLANQPPESPVRKNPKIQCNAIYKTGKSFNCYLTSSQAIEHACHLLQKAQAIIDNDIDAVVQVWNKGERNEKLYCGLIQPRKGPRRSNAKKEK